MSLPKITFIKGQGGLGRPLPGEDYISALCIYTANGNLPSGFSTSDRMKTFYALSDAVTAGILNTYSDATAAAGTWLATAVGSDGDTVPILVDEIGEDGVAVTTNLGTYTKVAGDTTVALVATAVAAVINAGTINHGYSASVNTATVTITFPKRLGIYPNTGTPLDITPVGTIAGTLTQPSAATLGVASRTAVWHYQISEFFRMQPAGILHVGFFATPGTYTFADITTMQSFAAGKIRQIGVIKDPAGAYATGDITLIDAVCKVNDTAKKPLSAIYSADLSGTADISTIADLAVLDDCKVSDCISQDAGGQGNYLWLTIGKSVPALGALLGTVALSGVGDSIAWVNEFNISNGAECEVIGFANGQKFTDVAITDTLLEALNTKRHIFLKKFVGRSGSYWNDSHTAVVSNNDYAYIENNRTIDKATRLLYVAYLPNLNSPLTLNADGTLAETTVSYLESVGETALDQMVRDAEISAKKMTINPAQDVLATSKIIIACDLVIKGVARTIEIPIGFKPSIA